MEPQGKSYRAWEDDSVQPRLDDPFFMDHVSRYYFAQKFIGANSDVLDVACGKGYGSAILSEHARSVLGIDLNEESLTLARRLYARPNSEYRAWDVTKVAELGRRFDVIVAFEIIEHLFPEQTETFLQGLAKALKPGGVCLISTPNHDVVTLSGVHVPEFHINNLGASELQRAVKPHFREVRFLGQHRRRGGIKDALMFLDRWNLRHRLKPVLKWARAAEQAVRAAAPEKTPASGTYWTPEIGSKVVAPYFFSPRLYRQAGLILAECRA